MTSASDFTSDILAPKTAKTLAAEKITKSQAGLVLDFSTNGLLNTPVPREVAKSNPFDFSTSALLAE